MEVMNYIGCLQTFSVKNQRVSILGSAGQKVSIESAHLCCYFNTQINGLSYLLTDAETVKYPRTVFTSFFQLFKSVKIILGSWIEKGTSGQTCLAAVAVGQGRGDSEMEELNSECILKLELAGLVAKLDMKCM